MLIDHLGRPLQGTPAEHEVVLSWSRFEHTFMKLSSLSDARSYPHRDLTPIIRRITDVFSPARCLHGGGFSASATAASYAAAFDRTRQYLAHLSPSDQAQVLGGNARRLLQL